MNKKTAEPMEEAKLEEQEERPSCAVCEQTLYGRRGGLQLCGEALLVCPFCAVYLNHEPRPELVPPLDSDMELLGAWHSFADDCIQWHLGLSWKFRYAKLNLDALLPEAVTAWALGSLYDKGGAQQAALVEVWPVLAYGRILKLNEVAATLADKMHESVDVSEIRAALAHPEVLRVWLLWLAANHDDGLSERGDFSTWYAIGARHGKDYFERRSPQYIEKQRADRQRWKARAA